MTGIPSISEIMKIVPILLLLSVTISTFGKDLDSYIEDKDRFPGWRGELPNAQDFRTDIVSYGEFGQVGAFQVV